MNHTSDISKNKIRRKKKKYFKEEKNKHLMKEPSQQRVAH